MDVAPLDGIRVVEMEGIGPGPFCGRHLVELGAEVILIERSGVGTGVRTLLNKGKKSVALDLKSAEGVRDALALIETADILIEGMRPGVMERLGLGPEVCLEANPALVYGRITGWGQDGPLAHAAGHDLNYASLSGAAWYSGRAGDMPVPPPTLVADIAGGAHYLMIGILAAYIRAKTTGKGDVVDAAMVDGTAHMMNLMLSLQPLGGLSFERGQSLLDGPPWYDMYTCSDGKRVSIGPLEPKFYHQFLMEAGLDEDPDFQNQFDKSKWDICREKLRALFITRTQAQWCEVFEGTDACFAPVLSPVEARDHPHMKVRGVYRDEGGVLLAKTAPRFSGASAVSGEEIPEKGEHTEEILGALKHGTKSLV